MIEIKIQQPDKRWEDTPVAITISTGASTEEQVVWAVCSIVAIIMDREVRWNWKDLLQGHYVSPSKYQSSVIFNAAQTLDYDEETLKELALDYVYGDARAGETFLAYMYRRAEKAKRPRPGLKPTMPDLLD